MLKQYKGNRRAFGDACEPVSVGEAVRCQHDRKIKCNNNKAAFSLVEMLMALLVASLLLAALAPVMTRRITDNVNVSGVGTYERLDYARAFYEDEEWAVPAGVNVIKVTAVGGGGAGGSATYGYKKFTYSGGVQNFTIPNGVTKIRVYAIAGGGGGSAGGDGTSTAYGNIPAIAANTESSITTAGSYTFANGITPPDSYKAPALNQNCKNSGATNWTLVSDSSTQVVPDAKINKIGVNGNSNVTLSKVTACGAGGGGNSAGGAGGSGGYLANQNLSVTNLANSITLRIGGGGNPGNIYSSSNNAGNCTGGNGGNGYGSGNAVQGSTGSCNGTGIYTGRNCGGGGGGGAATTILNGTNQVFQIGGGGGGGGYASVSSQSVAVTCAGGMGGNGYGSGAGCAGGGGYIAGTSYYGQSGGGGGGGFSGGSCTAGNNANNSAAGSGGTSGGTAGVRYQACSYSTNTGYVYYSYSQNGATPTGVGGTGGGAWGPGASGKWSSGGGGGGGLGGRGGQGGNYSLTAAGGVVPNSIFSSASNCSGGNSGSAGKPGAIKLWYSAAAVNNGLKCTYYTTTNAGGGGGTGQIWLGEVNVTPGETLSVNIGKGGNGATAKNGNGSNGGNTVISGSTTGSIITLLGGNGGKYSASGSTGGVSGGCSTQKPWKNWTGLSAFDTSNQTNLTNLGNGSAGGKAVDNNFAGGKGGQTYSIENAVLEGGNGGGGNANGNAPNTISYGTGGGGGGGNANVTVNAAGLGGNGGNGYVYIEWGEGAGGGGQSGQVVVDSNIWVSGGASKVKMIVGKGGTPGQETSVNWSGLLGKKGGKGEDTIIMVDSKTVLTAKGGYGGNPGILTNGTGGGKNGSENISNTVPGDNGENQKGGAGASLTKDIFPLLDVVDKISSSGGLGGSISTSGEGKTGSGYGAGGGGGIFLNNRAYQGGKGSNGMVYIEYKN